MGSAKKIASGVIWSLVVNLVNAIYGFISVPILINHFGKSEYGIIGLAMSINVYMQLMDMGFNSTNVRFFSSWLAKKDYVKTNKLFQTSLGFYGIIGLLNALILIGISCFSSSIFNLTPDQDQILKKLFYILAASAFVSWFSSCFDQLIKATENVAWIQRRTIIPKLLQIFILFITVCGNLSISIYFFLTTFALFSIIPMSVSKIKKETPFINFIPRIDKVTLKEILPYCLNIFSFSIFQFSFYNLRPVFLGIQGSMESVADYRILNGIIGVVSMFGSVFLNALLPSAAKAVSQNNKEAYYKVAYDGTKYISIVLSFCAFGMMTVGNEVITMYVGKSYLYLIPWFNLWLLCTLGVHNQAISSLILAGTNIRALTYNTCLASILGLIASWFLIPYYQIGGIIIAFIIYLSIQYIFYYFYYWPKKMKINSKQVFIESFIHYVIIGSIIYFIINKYLDFTIKQVFMSFLIKGVIFAILFFSLCLITTNKMERDKIRSFIKLKNKHK